MELSHLSLNRPVYLACRDVYYEQAIILLRELESESELSKRLMRCDHILFLLKTAHEHARNALRINSENKNDHEFLGFLGILIGYMRALENMFNLQQILLRGDSFIGCVTEAIGHAADFERHTGDLLKSSRDLLNLAGSPFAKLKKDNCKAMTKADRTRYNKARKKAEAIIKAKFGSLFENAARGAATMEQE